MGSSSPPTLVRVASVAGSIEPRANPLKEKRKESPVSRVAALKDSKFHLKMAWVLLVFLCVLMQVVDGQINLGSACTTWDVKILTALLETGNPDD